MAYYLLPLNVSILNFEQLGSKIVLKKSHLAKNRLFLNNCFNFLKPYCFFANYSHTSVHFSHRLNSRWCWFLHLRNFIIYYLQDKCCTRIIFSEVIGFTEKLPSLRVLVDEAAPGLTLIGKLQNHAM